MGTQLVKVFVEGDRPEAHDWREWRNVKPGDNVPALALNRWIRTRGGVATGERLTVVVYTAPGNVERQPNGEPLCCVATVFNVSKE